MEAERPDMEVAYEEAMKQAGGEPVESGPADYRDVLKNLSVSRPPVGSAAKQFKPGPTFPGMMPTEEVLESLERRGIDTNTVIPPTLRGKKENSPLEEWNKKNTEKKLSNRQMIILATMHKMMSDPGNLDSEYPHYPKVTAVRAWLSEAAGLEMQDVASLTQESINFLFRERYLKVYPDSPWHKTLAGMKKKV